MASYGRYIDDTNFYNDHRVRAKETGKWYKSINEKRMVAIVSIEIEPYVEEDTEVPFKYEVCPTCNGKGTHVNPSIDCNGLTREDFDEDPDFAEDYFKGIYNVPCYECGGRRVVPEMDLPENDPIAIKINKSIQEELEYQAICAAERAAGC